MRDEFESEVSSANKKAGTSAGLSLSVCNVGLRQSARRLAAAGGADLLLQSLKPDRADHHLFADHVARRTVHSHRFGKLEIFLDRGFRFRACHVLFELCGMDASVLGLGYRVSFFRRPTAYE